VRICSLVPAATEIVFALGLGDRVVGVTHECDWPPEATGRPAVTASLIESERLTSLEIDRAVSEAAGNGKPLYAIDEERWRELEADVVLVQELCDVCAVSRDEVDGLLSARPVDAEVIDVSPTTLGGVLATITALGVRLGAEGAADELTGGMRSRLDRVRAALADGDTIPRVYVCEWLDPPFSAGHWVPDMVEVAGGTDVAAAPGEPSRRMTWGDVAALDPEVILLAPCGFDLDRTITEIDVDTLQGHLLETAARREGKIFAVDANAYFSRPGPRLVDGVELLAHLLHPEAYSDPGLPWARVRV
jgi:iron complex transport system substrate-binding protein